MASTIPIEVRRRAAELISINNTSWDEVADMLGYPAKELRRVVYLLRQGRTENTYETKARQRAELIAAMDAGATLEELMARFGWGRKSTLERMRKVGYTMGDLKEIRIELGLELSPEAARAQRIAARKAEQEERARVAAQREAERLARRPALMLPPRVRAVIDPIARSEGVSLPDLTGGRRKPEFVRARHRAILALYATFPEQSLSWLGRPFGIHHTSVREVLVNAGVYKARGVRTAPWALKLAA